MLVAKVCSNVACDTVDKLSHGYRDMMRQTRHTASRSNSRHWRRTKVFPIPSYIQDSVDLSTIELLYGGADRIMGREIERISFTLPLLRSFQQLSGRMRVAYIPSHVGLVGLDHSGGNSKVQICLIRMVTKA